MQAYFGIVEYHGRVLGHAQTYTYSIIPSSFAHAIDTRALQQYYFTLVGWPPSAGS